MTMLAPSRSETKSFCKQLGPRQRSRGSELGKRRVLDTIFISSDAETDAGSVSPASRSRSPTRGPFSDPRIDTEKGPVSSVGERFEQTGLLFKSLSGPETERHFPSGFQHQEAELTCRLSSFQNGDSRKGSQGDTASGLDHITGPFGRIFSCADSPQVLQVSEVSNLKQPGVRVPSTAVWTQHRAICVYTLWKHSRPTCGFTVCRYMCI